MKFLLFLPFAFLSTGVWVKTDGTVLEVPCPDAVLFHGPHQGVQRLPGGCAAGAPGMWLSLEEYRSVRTERARLEAELEGKDAMIQDLKTQLSKAQSDLIICSAVPMCPECPSNGFLSGALLATALTTGGCALWTLSR